MGHGLQAGEGEKSAESLIPELEGVSKYAGEDVDGDVHDDAFDGAGKDAEV